MSDPNLLSPAPTPTAAVSVSPLPKFKNKNEFGDVVASHPALPPTKSDVTKHYVCSVKTASLHREDGKRLAFVDGFFSTDLIHDQHYLDREIADGNPYLSHATPEQVKAAAMKIDPRKVIREEVESDLRAKLEAEIKAEYEKKLADAIAGGKKDLTPAMPAVPSEDDKPPMTPEEKLALLRSGSATIKPASTKDLAATAATSGN